MNGDDVLKEGGELGVRWGGGDKKENIFLSFVDYFVCFYGHSWHCSGFAPRSALRDHF